VNLNAPLSVFPEELREKASSLLIAGGQVIDRAAFAARLLTHLEKLYVVWIEKGFSALKPAWERYAAWLLGKQITVAAPEGVMAGTVLGLDTEGALLIREGNSDTLKRILAGDVTVIAGYTHGEDA
jgi:BirA family biotin operon repressor/biotin-[acetyl-CoA-carboxylase] ligase